MHFCIYLNKIEHTEKYVRYEYYSYDSPDKIGIIELNFISDKFKEVQPAANDTNGYLFERAGMKIVKHWKKAEFPDNTCWVS
ncbi:MAG: hypothetical protein ACKOAD_00860 [Gammaproteobacteria bacterium]